jgi:hypothetical protein
MKYKKIGHAKKEEKYTADQAETEQSIHWKDHREYKFNIH